jgi:hypothetical protein
MKKHIEEALQPLIGLPLWQSYRTCSTLQGFSFGSRHTVPKHKGGTKEIGDYALHVECAWRIVGPEGIEVASRDRYYPAGDPDCEPPDFDWEQPGATRCDEKIKAFFEQYTDSSLRVLGLEADSVGSLRLELSGEFKLELFPDDSLVDEHWRFFSDGEHFVVTGQGIKR